ncbi:MAG: HEAT repeat domain-containing protein [Gemmatimonadales bacterium]
MPPELVEWFRPQSSAERLLLLLSLVSAALIVLIVLLAVAAFVLRWRNTRMARRWSRIEATWEELVLEVLEGTRPPDAVAHHLPHDEVPLFVEYLSRFARRLRGAERDRVGLLAAPFLPGVAQRMSHPDPALRARAAQVLSLLGFSQYSDRLAAALDDPEPIVAMMAARSLARRDHPEFAPVILARLHRFTLWDARFLSGMLAAMGPAAAPALLAVLADLGQPAPVRAVTADALGMLSHLPAADAAGTVLDRETDPELIAAVLRLLRQVGRPEHVPGIRAWLDAPTDFVREHAVAAFGALADARELRELAPKLDDRSPWVRLAAARAVRSLEDGRLLRELAAGEGPGSLVARAALAESAA